MYPNLKNREWVAVLNGKNKIQLSDNIADGILTQLQFSEFPGNNKLQTINNIVLEFPEETVYESFRETINYKP